MSRKEYIRVGKVIFVPIIVILYFAISIGVRWNRIDKYKGQWTQFDSQAHYQSETFPDGLRFDYPASWLIGTFESGSSPNIGRTLRVKLTDPNFLMREDTGIRIHWRRLDEDWSLADIRDWYIDEIERTINRSVLKAKRDDFQQSEIGQGSYPALMQDFSRLKRGPLPYYQVILFRVDDEAFVFIFNTSDRRNGSLDIFKRMLDSIEVYE